MNKVLLIGNLGALPEFKTLQTGEEISTFTLATDVFEKGSDDGLLHKITDWHNVTIYRKDVIDWLKQNIKNEVINKGERLKVEGRLSYLKMADKYLKERKIAHIVISDSDGDVNLSAKNIAGAIC